MAGVILVYVLTAWHAVAGGEVGRSIDVFPTRARCEFVRRHFVAQPHEHLTCQAMHLPRASLGAPA